MLRRVTAKDLVSRALRPTNPGRYAVPQAARLLVASQRIPANLRFYSPPPPGGGGGGFPGFSMGPQHQKGDALKEYVRLCLPDPLHLLTCAECRSDRVSEGGETGPYYRQRRG